MHKRQLIYSPCCGSINFRSGFQYVIKDNKRVNHYLNELTEKKKFCENTTGGHQSSRLACTQYPHPMKSKQKIIFFITAWNCFSSFISDFFLKPVSVRSILFFFTSTGRPLRPKLRNILLLPDNPLCTSFHQVRSSLYTSLVEALFLFHSLISSHQLTTISMTT